MLLLLRRLVVTRQCLDLSLLFTIYDIVKGNLDLKYY